MKRVKYETPVVEIVEFETEDIITTSVGNLYEDGLETGLIDGVLPF